MTEGGRRTAEPLPTEMELLADLSRLYKIQPATALWRAVEIREVLKAGLPTGRGLDLGCGDGALTGMILRYAGERPELDGLDYDHGEVRVAERRGVYRRTFCSGSEDMPLEDSSVDFVFSNSVLEHLTHLDATIAECARIIRPGGNLIATVPAPAFQTLLKAQGRTGAAREAYVTTMNARLAHKNYLDAAGWAALLSKHGFAGCSATPYFNRAQVERWEKLSAMTAGVLQKLGATNALLYRMQRLTRSDDRSAGGLLETNRGIARWSRHWARIVAGGVLDNPGTDDRYGCLLVSARKP
ncbi:class I SAM-dependent methyltransferase [Albidovulum sediminicola]|uniref:Methyltransferase domain-containing protein n=1 Tax=Albidovulum sediminicola TaxID=2984331 RepID=A0ABT2Z754_9RHOB|nr:methyltransferase domain-containing protein [Defluviimonas sp. WL0075]MCV2866928.1 methyltransferase domain-containing protein [Defluviimonas sp. WL0075]